MKKFYTTLAAVLAIVQISNAQWSGTAPGPIYYNYPGGNVGIGTSNLFKPLTVEAGNVAGVNQGLVINSAHAYGIGQGTAGAALVFSRNRTTDNASLSAQAQIVGGNTNETTSVGGFLSFYTTASSNTLTEAVHIDANQRVGIGTPSPAYPLDVNGTGRISGNLIVPTGYLGIGTSAPVVNSIIDAENNTNGTVGVVVHNSSAGSLARIRYQLQNDNSVVIFNLNGSQYGTDPGSFSIFAPTSFVFGTQGSEAMRINYGNLLIGKTSQTNSSYKLDVAGNVRSNQIVVNTTGADFVFEPAYKLPSLANVKEYIDKNHHLPGIASAKEMQSDGLDVGNTETKLLQKVEELTLYLIDKDKQLAKQQKQIEQLKKQDELRITALEKALAKLTTDK
ncbi:MAG: hypothetical protein JWR50_1417 [Mucilaginibacter sp.]|nr:hypothetical protein [Mucilaginibacter sp.]